jgi:putative hydrolase of HD superfamily
MVDCSLALEYEKRHNRNLQTFFDSSIPKLGHPEVREWGMDLVAEREHFKLEAQGSGSNDDKS